MKPIYILKPSNISPQLEKMISAAVANNKQIIIDCSHSIPDLRNKHIIVAAELNLAGLCPQLVNVLSELYEKGNDTLSGSTAIVLVHSPNQLYTKSFASSIVFLMNNLGCYFPGHPVIEATGDLSNFSTWKKTLDLPLEQICEQQCEKLGKRFTENVLVKSKEPSILVLHASHHKTSNTLFLWNMVKKHLSGCSIQEIHVENGNIRDCNGCSYKTCHHFGMQNSCFYGGIIVEEVYPAIEKADAVIWLCPNYNDSVSANIFAVINRMSALYLKTSFHNKKLFSIIVSGNSGSDSVAKQLIGALTINKGFSLPPYCCLMRTANDPGSIQHVSCIEDEAYLFAQNIKNNIFIL